MISNSNHEDGFERRLLASVRGTLATAVAFPQKSESVCFDFHRTRWALVFLVWWGRTNPNDQASIKRYSQYLQRHFEYDIIILEVAL